MLIGPVSVFFVAMFFWLMIGFCKKDLDLLWSELKKLLK